MPYFRRQPYGAAIDEAVAPVTAGTGEPDILPLAEAVLAESSGTPGAGFRARRPVRPGETARIKLQFATDGTGSAMSLRFAVDEMTGPGGVIPAAYLAVEPAEATIRADKAAVTTVSIAIPAQMQPGLYAGRLRVTGDDQFSETIEVTVAA